MTARRTLSRDFSEKRSGEGGYRTGRWDSLQSVRGPLYMMLLWGGHTVVTEGGGGATGRAWGWRRGRGKGWPYLDEGRDSASLIHKNVKHILNRKQCQTVKGSVSLNPHKNPFRWCHVISPSQSITTCVWESLDMQVCVCNKEKLSRQGTLWEDVHLMRTQRVGWF